MRIILVCLFLLFSGVVYAAPVVVESTDGEGNHVFTVTISAEDYKALIWREADPAHWVYILISNIIVSSRERMLPNLTDKRIETLSENETNTLINESTLKTKVERDAELISGR